MTTFSMILSIMIMILRIFPVSQYKSSNVSYRITPVTGRQSWLVKKILLFYVLLFETIQI